MTYLCPVCGYDGLEEPPQDDFICPCCATQFGYHDYAHSHAELRRNWIMAGARWFASWEGVPPGWDPIKQLRNVNYMATKSDIAAIKSPHVTATFDNGTGNPIATSRHAAQVR
jgi:hypothetical protein